MKKEQPISNNNDFGISEEKLNQWGLNEQEKDILESALALAETAKMLPEDTDKVLKIIDKKISEDYEKGLEDFTNIAQKDQKLFQSIIALYEVTNAVKEQSPIVETVSKKELNNQKIEDIIG